MQLEVPEVTAEYAPAAHPVHTAEEKAEASTPYNPPVHTVHASVPVDSVLNEPAAQPLQAVELFTRQQKFALLQLSLETKAE